MDKLPPYPRSDNGRGSPIDHHVTLTAAAIVAARPKIAAAGQVLGI